MPVHLLEGREGVPAGSKKGRKHDHRK